MVKQTFPAAADETADPEADRRFVVALARGLEVLRCFDAQRRELGTTELAGHARLPQSTVWRLCFTLQKLGFLVAVPGSDKLRLGPAAVALGAAALAGQEALDVARPLMQQMADRYRAAVALGRRDDTSIVYLARCQGDSPLLMNLRVGSRIPLYRSAIGWAYLAAGPEHERAQALRAVDEETGQTFEEALALYQQRGFVLHCRVQHHINTVAAAIELGNGERYVISCGGPASALPVDLMLGKVGPELVTLANELRPILLLGRRNT